ncbi:MAG: hypothetical protein LBQ18_03540 [Campylobacteraceae bacterium]|jgi:hypothetical protein|nr:hypothetical protein [Campylobacteraceae bacterium]
MKKIRVIFICFIALFLAGCQSDTTRHDVSASNTSGTYLKCSGVNVCGYKNSGSDNAYLDISLSDIADKDITIVFTNEGDTDVSLPFIRVETLLRDEIRQNKERESADAFKYISGVIKDFKPAELAEQNSGINLSPQPSYKVWFEGNKSSWNIHSDFAVQGGTSREATLVKQLTVLGRTINIWVEDSEFGSIDYEKIDDIASSIDTVYTNVVSIAGEPWGVHNASNLIPSGQPLDIVFVKLSDVGGYFWPRDNYKNTTYPNSNEALAIMIDTDTLHLGGKLITLGSIAHEITHAINFYQRFVRMGSDAAFGNFLNEMTAIMMEDIVAKKISYNGVGGRYKSWLNASLYHLDVTEWMYADSRSYDIAGSFGAFLLRQHGTDFYKTLLKTRSDLSINDTHAKSVNILDKAVKAYNGEGLGLALRNWGASIAMFPISATPQGFGYPARSDNGIELEAFDGSVYKQYRNLPTSSPLTLTAHAHFPFLRKTSSATYKETFIVPKGVSVSVIVQ